MKVSTRITSISKPKGRVGAYLVKPTDAKLASSKK